MMCEEDAMSHNTVAGRNAAAIADCLWRTVVAVGSEREGPRCWDPLETIHLHARTRHTGARRESGGKRSEQEISYRQAATGNHSERERQARLSLAVEAVLRYPR